MNERAGGALRIVLADDHALFRRGLRGLLTSQPDFQVVAECSNGEEAVAAALAERPEITLLDLNMPVMDGLQATSRLLAEWPEARVVILTVSDREENLYEAIKAGARGYLLKDLEPEDLFHYLRSVRRGEVPISGVLATRILQEFGSPERAAQALSRQPGRTLLTEREQEVLELVRQGLTNKEIAAQLFISENTVKIHMKHILEKLQVSNRAQAAVYGLGEKKGQRPNPPRR